MAYEYTSVAHLSDSILEENFLENNIKCHQETSNSLAIFLKSSKNFSKIPEFLEEIFGANIFHLRIPVSEKMKAPGGNHELVRSKLTIL